VSRPACRRLVLRVVPGFFTVAISLNGVPGFAALVAIGPVDNHGVLTDLNYLVEHLVDFDLVGIAHFAMVGNFDDRLTGDLGIRRLVDVGRMNRNASIS